MNILAFISANKRWLGAGFLLTFFSSYGQTFFISLSGGALRETFDLSNGEFGTLYMAGTLASAATMIFLGKMVDHMSPKKIAAIVILALMLTALAMSFTQSVLMLVVVIFGLRFLGQGMLSHIAMTVIARWFVASRGRAISLSALGHQAGEAILPAIVLA